MWQEKDPVRVQYSKLYAEAVVCVTEAVQISLHLMDPAVILSVIANILSKYIQ
jgi:hypothetical protein